MNYSKTLNSTLMAQARQSLQGKWGLVIGAIIINFLVGMISVIPLVGWIASIIICPVVYIGLMTFTLCISRDKEAKIDKHSNIAKKTIRLINDFTNKNFIFSEVDSNPHIKNLQNGIEKFKSDNFDGVIAFGGGSALDLGKLIAFISFFEPKKFSKRCITSYFF